MISGPFNQDDDTPEGIVDHEALTRIVEQAVDALRPLGLTVIPDGVATQIQRGMVVLLLPCQVRPIAKRKLHEDDQAKEAFNLMMKQQHDAMIDEKVAQISALTDDDSLEAALFSDDDDSDCSHENRHPVEGFCLDCNFGLEP